MGLRSLLLCLASLAVGAALGALFVNTAGYDALQHEVQTELREMRRRAIAGDEVAGRAFDGLSAYIHGEPWPKTVFFHKGMHIDDDGFWTR